jgi:voltage-gated potassium channel
MVPRTVEFLNQALAATILSTLTLAIESAGMAVLIHRARAYFARGIKTRSLWHTVLMIRFTSMTILLQPDTDSVVGCFFIASDASDHGNPASISRRPATPLWGTAMLSFRRSGACLGRSKRFMGVLMCGISVSTLFAIATRLIGNEAQSSAVTLKNVA